MVEHGVGTAKLRLVQGDITTEAVDAIVNAANSSLLGGGGVDGAIHRAGGPAILDECKAIVARQGRLPTGQAVITTAGNMPAKHVIHTVGPVWSGGRRGEAELLADCYRNSLALAAKHGCRTVAFPAVSCGVYGYPLEAACRIAVQEVRKFLADHAEIDQVTFVAFGEDVRAAYEKALAELGAT